MYVYVRIFHIHEAGAVGGREFPAARVAGFSFTPELGLGTAKWSRILPSTMDSAPRAPFPSSSARTPKFWPSPGSSLWPFTRYRKLALEILGSEPRVTMNLKSTGCGWRALFAPCPVLTECPRVDIPFACSPILHLCEERSVTLSPFCGRSLTPTTFFDQLLTTTP